MESIAQTGLQGAQSALFAAGKAAERITEATSRTGSQVPAEEARVQQPASEAPAPRPAKLNPPDIPPTDQLIQGQVDLMRAEVAYRASIGVIRAADEMARETLKLA